MGESDKVTVLVTFYNQVDYVDKALQSIFDQRTDFKYSVVVGDDGSDDGTIEKINDWINKYPERIELHIMERDDKKYISGFRASKNRLNLLKYVKGEYFIYLDGDDWYCDTSKLQRQYDILEDEKNRDCIACAHNTDRMYPDGSRIPITRAGISEGKYSPEKYWKYLYFHTDSLLIRSSIISSIPCDLLENTFNDNMITYCVIQHGKIYYIPESWAVYMQTDTGLWTGGNKVVNLLRDMLMYDLCNQINPEMKRITDYRMAYTWFWLFRRRKAIAQTDTELLLAEAYDKKTVCSQLWLNYSELGMADRFGLCVKSLRNTLVFAINLIPRMIFYCNR